MSRCYTEERVPDRLCLRPVVLRPDACCFPPQPSVERTLSLSIQRRARRIYPSSFHDTRPGRCGPVTYPKSGNSLLDDDINHKRYADENNAVRGTLQQAPWNPNKPGTVPAQERRSDVCRGHRRDSARSAEWQPAVGEDTSSWAPKKGRGGRRSSCRWSKGRPYSYTQRSVVLEAREPTQGDEPLGPSGARTLSVELGTMPATRHLRLHDLSRRWTETESIVASSRLLRDKARKDFPF